MTFGLSGAALAGIAVGGATLVSGLAQSNAAQSAAETQAGASQAGIEEQRRQFDAIQKLLAPYVAAGTPALEAQEALLQRASATGGLRGGNIQGALAQFRPQLLSSLIEQQYGRLGGMTSLGQQSAVGVGNAGMQTGANVSRLLGEQGAAEAGGQIAQGRAFGAIPAGIAGGLGIYSGLGGKFGSASRPSGGLMDELRSYGVF